ncbi:DUF3861 domain-containing protein [Photobacterium nomapromontoriensis]|uniref:DUF3861 domain-containing protein n=1 Tax=Photobacterium nomapromontoriensis TaxID=2910237 RepID=UPI003D127CC4
MNPIIRKDKHYRITVEEVGAEQESLQTRRIEFHDREDLFKIIDNLKHGSGLEPDTATKLGLALRLLGPEMMRNRKHPLFSDFMPHFKNFMQKLKNTVKEAMKK